MERKEISSFTRAKKVVEMAGFEPTKKRVQQAKEIKTQMGMENLVATLELMKENHPNADLRDAANAWMKVNGKDKAYENTAKLFRTVARIHPDANLYDTMKATLKFGAKPVQQALRDLRDGKASGRVYSIVKNRQ